MNKENIKPKSKLSFRYWFSFVFIGLIGQIAWVIENMYLNVFIYNFNQTNYALFISITVAVSAVVAMFTTLLIGSLSDKIGKRKIFITIGYILWGVSTLAFAFINETNIKYLFPGANVALVASISIIILDVLMTFFGSSANDAAFNSYVTINTNEKNRGKVEGVLSILPLFAMIIVFGVLDSFTKADHWDIFYYVVGGVTILAGIIAIFLLPKETTEKKKNSFIQNLLYGFKPKNIKNNKMLYVLYACYFVYSTATNIFMPYLMIYIQEVLGFSSIFAILLGSVLIMGAGISVLFGFLMDKFGKIKALIPGTLFFCFGILLVYFVKPNQVTFFIIAATVMMGGYMIVNGCINANIRDYTPVGKEGSYQGIRMIFQVALPMCIGPFAGMAIINSFSNNTYINDYNEVTKLPNDLLFLITFFIMLLGLVPMYCVYKMNKNKNNNMNDKNNTGILSKTIDPNDCEKPLDEHPNRQFYRDDFRILNGLWNLKILKKGSNEEIYNGKINVPYSVESPLSGVSHLLQIDEYLLYELEIQNVFTKDRVILHFEGVDQESKVFIDDIEIIENHTGYSPFNVDISKFIKSKKSFVLRVEVSDVTDSSYFSKGKQRLNRGGIWYTSSSGIYKTVWIEETPNEYISNISFESDFDNKKEIILISSNVDKEISFIVENIEYKIRTNEKFSFSPIDFKPWSPDDPFLYDCVIKLGDDEVHSYFAIRKFEKKMSNNGVWHCYLNNKQIFLTGILHQGYYYKGNLTPASYDDYLFDIKALKSMGFNLIRMHIKIEMDMFYYYCDKEGLLVMQDFVNGGSNYNFLLISLPAITPIKFNDHRYSLFGRKDENSRNEYIKNSISTMQLCRNHPSVISYTIFNEGWGQFDSKIIYDLFKKVDETRLFDVNSGWYDTKCGDFISKHIYFTKLKNFKDKNRAYLLSEFGGYSLFIKDNFYGKKPFGYKMYSDDLKSKGKNSEKFLNDFYKLYEDKIIPLATEGLCGCIYTQFCDVEDEVNGLYTFDRKILKINSDKMFEINTKLKESIHQISKNN